MTEADGADGGTPAPFDVLVDRATQGDRPALEALMPIVYGELRRLAAHYLRGERPGQTLQPTALVHEAYLKLLKDRPERWQNRAHFSAIAAHAMRQILIERARAREALELDAAGRERLLAREEAAHPRIASEVRALLQAHEQSGDFLEQPAWVAAPELLVDAPADAPLTGRKIGPYQVREEVGRGGMGVVYAAEDERLGRVVALKMLPPAYSRDSVARERLAREARAAAALSHPSIATVYALEEIDGDLFIASELVDGATLRAGLSSGPIDKARLLGTVMQIAEALDAAHRHGIVHRDLKPENVLCTSEGRIKVVDFGIARSVAPIARAGLTLTGTRLGTTGYMAPEQLRG